MGTPTQVLSPLLGRLAPTVDLVGLDRGRVSSADLCSLTRFPPLGPSSRSSTSPTRNCETKLGSVTLTPVIRADIETRL